MPCKIITRTYFSILPCNHNVVSRNIVLRYMFAIVVLIMLLTVNQHIFIESVTFTHHTVLQCCHSLDGYMYIQHVGTENYSALSSSEPVDFTIDCIFFTKGCESPGTVTTTVTSIVVVVVLHFFFAGSVLISVDSLVRSMIFGLCTVLLVDVEEGGKVTLVAPS